MGLEPAIEDGGFVEADDGVDGLGRTAGGFGSPGQQEQPVGGGGLSRRTRTRTGQAVEV